MPDVTQSPRPDDGEDAPGDHVSDRVKAQLLDVIHTRLRGYADPPIPPTHDKERSPAEEVAAYGHKMRALSGAAIEYGFPDPLAHVREATKHRPPSEGWAETLPVAAMQGLCPAMCSDTYTLVLLDNDQVVCVNPDCDTPVLLRPPWRHSRKRAADAFFDLSVPRVANADELAAAHAAGQAAGLETAKVERAAVIDGFARAIVLTREYVGEKMLPPVEGWEWFDVLATYAPRTAARLADEARAVPSTPETRPGHPQSATGSGQRKTGKSVEPRVAPNPPEPPKPTAKVDRPVVTLRAAFFEERSRLHAVPDDALLAEVAARGLLFHQRLEARPDGGYPHGPPGNNVCRFVTGWQHHTGDDQ